MTTVEKAWTLLKAVDADPLEVARASETIIAHCHARQLHALDQLSQQADLGADPDGVVVDPTGAEVACALHWTPGAASSRLDLAQRIVEDLPAVHTGLHDGRIDLGKAHEISRGLCELTPDHQTLLTGPAVDYAATHTRSQLRAWLTRAVDRIDPEASARRRRAAHRRRSVWVTPDTDGMATLSAYLTAEEAQACIASIRAAVTGIDGPERANQADALVALLTGITPAQPIPVTVLLTTDGAELVGHGPMSHDHANDLCRHAPAQRLTPPAPTVRYRPTSALERYIRARDRHCRFPGCRRPAVSCDLDHTVAYPHGATDESNLHSLCRYHHRLKTHTGWTVRILPGHALAWISPRGRVYITYLDDP